uniref:Proteasome subunit beta n=1 Tax=Chromera velia CCMP2878 TaxID=1169474 RepID=A0A0G4GZ24_9ALVE|mmetsp:Transcript_44618/g.88182  ORF Transcript_44618/g.88182 Transcript_44618/m.88182 type:complete len:192 (-) Transcript_44618:463-1038(-)|eukprot:Cvel_23990.t1-p1 / transcript=Cvel_23990.t1 / gene=Cvel_23990 / organism=Chromera_velia_CCMP2878 / gene_product=Proteasome subunit beta type-2-A, putative / transcript_product=Proteasome subunit beta type-2-A, putative / location=Cvel_scaffold2542:12801-16297(+) / protein_length=191 / sequence_SO=supercontig / SO=protein_coding / is_pseudo=false
MESAFGIQGKDFVLLCADSYAAFSVFRFKEDEDKIMKIDDDKLIVGAGPYSDMTQFTHYVQKNAHLHRLRTSTKLSTSAFANYTRGELAHALRRGPYQVNLLVAGMDDGQPSLFWIDYLSSMVKSTKAAHGYAAYFLGGLLDRYWKKDLTQPEAIEIAKKCIEELKTRMIISQSHFTIKIVDSTGIKTVEL